MSFFNEIAKIFKLTPSDVFGSLTLVWGDGVLYVEGVTKVVFFSGSEVYLAGKSEGVRIFGEALSADELGGKAMGISGEISRIERARFFGKKGDVRAEKCGTRGGNSK